MAQKSSGQHSPCGSYEIPELKSDHLPGVSKRVYVKDNDKLSMSLQITEDNTDTVTNKAKPLSKAFLSQFVKGKYLHNYIIYTQK